MSVIDALLMYPEDLDPHAETLPCGAVIRVWRASKLVSGHGIRSERTPVATGGLVFEVTFPAPWYGPATPIISRLRADRAWTADQARARYAALCVQAEQEVERNKRRDRLHTFFQDDVPDDVMAWLYDNARIHHLHLDYALLNDAQLDRWESLLSHVRARSRAQAQVS